MQQWLTKAGPYRIEHYPCPHSNRQVDLSVREGVLHTIEGSLESGMNVFRQHYAPHFVPGIDRRNRVKIYQCVPLGYMAGTLVNLEGGVETNFEAEVQVELAGYSKKIPWLPVPQLADALAELFVVLKHVCDIPLARPFPNNPGPEPWATAMYPRRRTGKWGRVAGWFMHMEVPENKHWDAGYFNWDAFMARCREKDRRDQGLSTGLQERHWKYGRWYWGLGEFSHHGPKVDFLRPISFPRGAVMPDTYKRTVQWYKEHVVADRRQVDRVRTFSMSRAAKKAKPAPLCKAVS